MAGPVIAATATRVAAFSPLLFWPGIVGEFMKYLPLTLIATLSASLRRGAVLHADARRAARPRRTGEEGRALADRGLYMRIVKVALHHPFMTLGARQSSLLVGVVQAYGKFGNGVEFFPDIEPDYGLVQVRARGNLSIQEKDNLVRQVEERILGMPEIATVYARAGEGQRGSDEVTEDTVGTVQFELVDWKQRRKASVILDEIRAKTADIPGVIIEVTKPQGGPPTGKPITLEISSVEPELLYPAAAKKVADIVRKNPTVARRGRRPAAPRHRLEARRRQGGGGEIRREPAHRRHRRAARDERREGLRIPAGHDRQVRGHPGALPGKPPEPRRARRADA